ncbi:MAG: (5-formylfuran-3-yl)methyl phosphate synthase [Methanosphaera sp.]|nr:(5-formylfuran-3-yl)methyl phosphate synthase [Methanosphaera sp.]
MELLVSAINLNEAKEALIGEADILDIKNPKEGSLGANFPWVIKQISQYVDKSKIISTTVGDVDYKPGTVSLAALGCAVSGSDYVKVGLYGTHDYNQAKEVMDAVVKSVKQYNDKITVVACGYADYYNINSVSSQDIIEVARDSNCDVAMLDTYNKNGNTLTDYQSSEELASFVDKAHSYNLKVALAGSVNQSHITLLEQINCDIMGVRGCVCSGGDRNTGHIDNRLVKQLQDNI